MADLELRQERQPVVILPLLEEEQGLVAVAVLVDLAVVASLAVLPVVVVVVVAFGVVMVAM